MSGAMKGKIIPFRPAPSPSKELSDQALVGACASGDTEALARLYDRFSDDLHKFVSRLTFVGGQDAEDIVQEAFLSVFRSAKRFGGRSAVRTWIFAIGANVARDAARRQRNARSTEQRLSELPAMKLVRTPEAEVITREQIRRIRARLVTLPHDVRVAFVLCDVERIAGKEAAAALGVPTGTLYRRLHDARKALRRALEEGGE